MYFSYKNSKISAKKVSIRNLFAMRSAPFFPPPALRAQENPPKVFRSLCREFDKFFSDFAKFNFSLLTRDFAQSNIKID